METWKELLWVTPKPNSSPQMHIFLMSVKSDFLIQIVSNLIVSWCSCWKDDCASPMHHFCNVHYSCVFYSVSISLRDDSYDTTSDKGHQASL